MVYIPEYGWYVILGLTLTPKQREVFEVQFCNWCEKQEKVVLREKSDIGLWIQTWSNLENMTIKLVINFLVGNLLGYTYVK